MGVSYYNRIAGVKATIDRGYSSIVFDSSYHPLNRPQVSVPADTCVKIEHFHAGRAIIA